MAIESSQLIVAMPENGSSYPIDKLEAHVKGVRHHAISVFITCGDEMLIQQRALDKYHSGGLWANACCSHPAPAEDAADCAHRRLFEELGIHLPMEHMGTYDYRADVGNGLWEAEFVDLFHAKVESKDLPLALVASEVADAQWISISALKNHLARSPEQFTAWFKLYMGDESSIAKHFGNS